MSSLSKKQKQNWQTFLEAKSQIEALGISVKLVPLAFDHDQGVWWTDYACAYIGHFFPELDNDDRPSLSVSIKVDDNGVYLPDKEIHIDHSGIQKALKKQFLAIMGDYPWFAWGGRGNHAMFIRL